MKNLKYIDCVSLTALESQQTNGGTTVLKTSFWQDIAYVGASIIRGLAEFSTQGGRNAGLCVK